MPLSLVAASAQDELVSFLREELQRASEELQIRKDLVGMTNIISKLALTIAHLEEWMSHQSQEDQDNGAIQKRE